MNNVFKLFLYIQWVVDENEAVVNVHQMGKKSRIYIACICLLTATFEVAQLIMHVLALFRI